MAKVAFASPFARLTGSLRAGSGQPKIAVRGGSSPPVAMSRTSPSGFPSPAQAWIRSKLPLVNSAWQLLSLAQASAWLAFSRRLRFTNSVGQRYSPGAFNAFRYLNEPAAISGLPILDDAPAAGDAPPIGGIYDVSLSAGPGQVQIGFRTLHPATWFRMLVTHPIATGNRRLSVRDYHILYHVQIVGVGPVGSLNAAIFPTEFFDLVAGDQVSLSLALLNARYQSALPEIFPITIA